MDPLKHRGRVVIIANSFFLPTCTTRLSARRGTEFDIDELTRVFEWLSFEVVVHNNLSSEVRNILLLTIYLTS